MDKYFRAIRFVGLILMGLSFVNVGLTEAAPQIFSDELKIKVQGMALDAMNSLNSNQKIYFSMRGPSDNGALLNIWNNNSTNAYFQTINKITQKTDFIIKGDGKVGIGMFSPSAQLQIRGKNLSADTGLTVSTNPVDGGTVAHFILRQNANSKGTVLKVDHDIYGDRYKGFNLIVARVNDTLNHMSEVKFLVRGDGNVGIGTSNPKSKLAVSGTITAKEIKVVLDVNAIPDFVFESNYKLASLNEVEDYINDNNHLPEIPSAQAIASNGGVNMGEMQMKILQKVEELTLYTIKQGKEISTLKKENDLFRKQFAAMTATIK